MRISNRVIFNLAVLVAAGSVLAPHLARSQSGEDHEASIAWLEKRVKDQDEIIAWHKKMRNSAVGRSYGTENIPSGTGSDVMGREMQAHCEEIIQTAEKLKEELQSFADWHRDKVTLTSDTFEHKEHH